MLAIDCGNTRIKWARFHAGRRDEGGSASLRGEGDPFARLAASLDSGIQRVLVANVAGSAVADRISATVSGRLGLAPEFIRVLPKAHGIECAYREPATLGVDRWLAMIATRRLVDGAFVVVAAGTAVTFDAVDADGHHLGGLILPGDRLMIDAMASNTDQIPLVAPAVDAVSGLRLLGRSTAEAVSHGTRLALAAAIDRAVAEVADALSVELAVLVTGGDGPALAEWLASKVEVRADLVLDGLAAVAADGE
jgi:type III pantothenate kinase